MPLLLEGVRECAMCEGILGRAEIIELVVALVMFKSRPAPLEPAAAIDSPLAPKWKAAEPALAAVSWRW